LQWILEAAAAVELPLPLLVQEWAVTTVWRLSLSALAKTGLLECNSLSPPAEPLLIAPAWVLLMVSTPSVMLARRRPQPCPQHFPLLLPSLQDVAMTWR
jgi:hypothetical protein